jgi:hypothetical protein
MANVDTVSVRVVRFPSIAGFIAFGFAALFLSAISALPNDAWKDKDPEAWDQKDVQKILTDSPWSKQLQFGTAADGSLSSSAPTIGSSAVSETSGASSNGSRIGAGPGPRDNGPSGAPSGLGPLAKFTVNWRSSLTVRRAALRERELSHMSADQASKNLAKQYDAYEIAISGADLRAFVKEGAESFKARSYLTVRSTKQKISPSNVIIETRQDGSPVAIVFQFPKKTPAGEPAIVSSEKSAEFAAKVGSMPVKVTFDLSKMSTKEGPDL